MIWIAQRARYQALADPKAVVQIDIDALTYKIGDRQLRKKYRPGSVVDWFSDFPYVSWGDVVQRGVKYRAVHDHFVNGVPWAETELFRKAYAARFEAGKRVRGCATVEELVRHYEARIDSLYHSMRASGFHRPAETDDGVESLYVHIGPQGELMMGFDGNHRIYVAHVLGIRTIPVRVYARHREWQKVRELAHRARGGARPAVVERYKDHPDLADLLV